MLCLGYGYTAKRLAPRLIKEGWRIAGTTRSPEKAGSIAAEGIEPVLWRGATLDGNTQENALTQATFDGANAVLVSTGPSENGCPALAAAEAALAERASLSDRPLQWIGYLSSNGVYGNHDGAWVDENTPPAPTGARGKRRLAAENVWRAFADTHNLPLVIFRLPGIYGPGRSAFDRLRSGDATRMVKPGQVFSRAHVDDIATAVKASLEAPSAGALYNVADDEPAPPQDVTAYAAQLLGIEPPPETPLDETQISPMAKSFWADNKRVSNALMKSALGVQLAYPSFREGLKAIQDEEANGNSP